MLLDDKRFFYFEDDVSNRAIVQLIMEQHGAEFQFERWGHDPLDRLAAFMPIDMILMDLMFPKGVSGYDLFTQIRADRRFDHIPIVAISAADPSTEIPKAKSMGFSGYISKPVNLIHFPQQLVAILNAKPVWDLV
jgi:CheY-like chemotaxis protein